MSILNLKTTVATLIVATGVATPMIMQYQANGRLQKENLALKERTAQLEEKQRLGADSSAPTSSSRP